MDNKNLEMFEGIDIPERLKPENIAKMLEESKQTSSDNKNITVKSNNIKVRKASKKSKIIASIAACAVIVTGVVAAFNANKNQFPTVNGTSYSFFTELKQQKNYNDVYMTLKELYASSKRNYKSTNEFVTDDFAIETSLADNNSNTSSNSANNDYSKTHQQVEGVEEADIIKTDGDMIYYVGGSTFYIVKSDNGNLSLVSKIYDENIRANEMYLVGDKVVLISNRYIYSKNTTMVDDPYIEYSPTGYTIVDIIDISDKANPKVISTYKQNGVYVSSRMIDNYLYISTSYYNYSSEPIDNPVEIEKYIPSYCVNDNQKFIAAEDINIPEKCTSTTYTIVSGLDINSEDMLVSTKALLGFDGKVYCSKDNYYVAGTIWGNRDLKSQIARFSINNGKIEHTGYCEVEGEVLNQFSMDEYNGYFRVATTDYNYLRHYETSGVYIFDKDMKEVGKVDGLAKNETIRSVRFENDYVYLVTFEQTDPLFKIDLSNPEKPKVLSELKINGYSAYLINYGEGKLLGFGIDADDKGRQTGLKLSMFSKGSNDEVKEITTLSLGDDLRYATSIGIYNHKALLIDAEKNVIGIPVCFYDGIDYCNRYYLFKYTDSKGFEEIGHIETHDFNDRYAFSRGMYIGDKLYMFTPARIVCASIEDMKMISSIDLETPSKKTEHTQD